MPHTLTRIQPTHTSVVLVLYFASVHAISSKRMTSGKVEGIKKLNKFIDSRKLHYGMHYFQNFSGDYMYTLPKYSTK